MAENASELSMLNQRSRAVLRQIVESYISTGDPVGSRNLSRALPMTLSPASIRNVMSDLEALGLIYAPHTSAGRMPTHTGLRLFVDGLLEVGDLADDERRQIEAQIGGNQNKTVENVLQEAGEMISGLSHCAGLVLTEKQSTALKQVEFVPLEPGKALAVLVGENQDVENRIIDLPTGLPASALIEASNYLNAHIRGKTISQALRHLGKQMTAAKAELDGLAQKVIEAGFAEWSGGTDEQKSLIIRGQSNLLKDVSATEDVDRIRQLFDDIEAKNELLQILGEADQADGVRIFIGSENNLFSLSGSSLIVAPFNDTEKNVVGVVGVIGPTRLNYARIIPMVDYTAKLINKLLT